MKKLKLLFNALLISTAVIIAFSSTACVLLDNIDPLPPGQAKKITGDKNAKDLAPGQNNR